MYFILLSFLFIFNTTTAKEILTESKIKDFLTEENPYIYTIIGKKHVYQGKRKYYEGFFDTILYGKYERKDYPVSTGKFTSIFIKKPFFNSIELLAGYRKATGVQEFNNIKTGEYGELQIGLKIPVFQLKNKIDKRRLNLFLTDLQIKQIDFEFQNKFRKLYLKIISSYYKAIYYKQLLNLEEELLNKAKNRIAFIKQKIQKGALPKVYELEANQHIINRIQRVLKAKNNYEIYLNEFIKYLNITKEKFTKEYELPSYLELPSFSIDKKKALEIAINNRPDLYFLLLEKEKLKQEKSFFSLLKYPKFTVSIYGVQDFKYDEGYKLSIDISYPLERRKYIGKSIEIGKNLYLLDKKLEKIKIEIQTKINNIFQTKETLEKNIENIIREIELVKKLEEIERKKLKAGVGTLFLINQREIYTLKTMKKYLKYKLDYIILHKKLLSELNLL